MLSIATAPVAAQSLADVARQEEARRATSPKATRSYSNENIGAGAATGTIAADAAVSCYMSITLGRCVTADELLAITAKNIKTAENAPKEPAFRSEAESIRKELAYLQKDIAALTAQSEDDSLSAVKRQQAEAKLALTRPQFDHALQRWSKLEKEVRTQELPHDWIEPVPPQVSNPK